MDDSYIDGNSGDEREVLHSSLEDSDGYVDEITDAYNTCLNCGRRTNFSNDDGNGFCIKCGLNY